jgi:hypothetical protein
VWVFEMEARSRRGVTVARLRGATVRLRPILPGSLFSREFGAAGVVERCEVVLHDLPQERWRNLPVFVAQDVPYGRDLCPRIEPLQQSAVNKEMEPQNTPDTQTTQAETGLIFYPNK